MTSCRSRGRPTGRKRGSDMPVKEIREDGTALFVCPDCGREFTGDYNIDENSFCADTLKSMAERRTCRECEVKHQEELARQEKLRRQAELDATLDERLERAGIPKKFRGMEKPFVRHTAEWIYRNRESSLLISGATGTGKTSSACFIVRLMLRARYMSVRYTSRQELFADYVRAKTTDGDNEYSFLARLAKIDLLIIDEMVGKKGDAKLSDSAQELFFNLIDGVYSEARDTRVWLLGNFYRGSIDRLVDDPEPLKRRLRESFKTAWFDMDRVDETVTPD